MLGRCWSGTSVLPGSGNVCVEWNALCREESAQLPTRLSPSTDKFTRRRLQPAAPTAVRSLSPRFLFPDDRPQITPPLRIRDGTRRHVPSSQQESPDSARRGLTLQLTAFSLLRHAGASTTQVDGAGFGEEGKKSVTKHQTSASRRGSVSIKAESL